MHIDGVEMDFLGPAGFLNALSMNHRLEEDGCAHWGIVCSSWVFLSRGVTQRVDHSFAKMRGDERIKIVREGNVMAARQVLLLVFLMAKAVWWLTEQPSSTVLHRSPWYQWLCSIERAVYSVFTWMGAFGHASRKGTELFYAGDNHWAWRLARQLPAESGHVDNMVDHLPPGRNGNARVTGRKAELVASQAYPRAYGQAVHQYWRESRQEGTKAKHALPLNMDPRMECDSDDEIDYAQWQRATLEAKRRYDIDWIRDCDFESVAEHISIPLHVPLV